MSFHLKFPLLYILLICISDHFSISSRRFDEAELMMRIKQEVQEVYPDMDFSNPVPTAGSGMHRHPSASSSPSSPRDHYQAKRHFHATSPHDEDEEVGGDPRGVQVKAGQMVMDPDLMDQYDGEEDGEDLSGDFLPEKRRRLTASDGVDEDVHGTERSRVAVVEGEGRYLNVPTSKEDIEARDSTRPKGDDSMELREGDVRRGLTQPISFQSEKYSPEGKGGRSWEAEHQAGADTDKEDQPLPSEETEAERALRVVQERLEREQAEDLRIETETLQASTTSQDRLQNGYRHNRTYAEQAANSTSVTTVANSGKFYPDGEGNTVFSTLSSQFSPPDDSLGDDLPEGRSGDARGSNDHFLGCEGQEEKGHNDGDADKINSKNRFGDDGISCSPLNFSTASFLGSDSSSRRLHQNGMDSRDSHDGEDAYSSGKPRDCVNGDIEAISSSKGLMKDSLTLSPMSRPFVVQLPDTDPTFPASKHQSPSLDS